MQPDLTNVLEDFGRRLLELRRARGWTQQEAAERLGWGVRDYRAAELGGRNLRISTVVDVSRIFDVAISELFGQPSSREARRPGRPRLQVAVSPNPITPKRRTRAG